MSEDMVFDVCERRKVDVRIGKDLYDLYEASGASGVHFKNAQMETRVYGPDGVLVGLRNVANLEPLLVSLCLFKKDSDVPVAKSVITGWPFRIQKALFDKIVEISDLDDRILRPAAALKKALLATGAPITWEQLGVFVTQVLDPEVDQIKPWFKPTPEELAKNEQSGTTAGSGSPSA
jgi:hypothetical protein